MNALIAELKLMRMVRPVDAITRLWSAKLADGVHVMGLAEMTDLHHKRRQCQDKADETGERWAIFTWSNDFEPKCLCDAPLRMVPAGTDIEAVLQPGVK